MIAGIFHEGSGLGNQLHRYVATRVLALDKGVHWGMISPELFKGCGFMSLDVGYTFTPALMNQFNEKKIVENGVDIRGYDPEINFVENNTIMDGEFQDSRYFMHRIDEVREWLKVEPLEMPDDLCVINFRGGEYTMVPELFLENEYWDRAIAEMLKIDPGMQFEVHTDDPITAQYFFPEYPIIRNIGLNWRSIRYAKYLILSNSSFAILPALCSTEVKKVIAPRYWARHNTKVWALPQNYYKEFTYI